MMKLKKLPKFKSISQEQEFWRTHDSTEYLDWHQAKQAIFPNLKPSTKTISLRLPESLLNEIRTIANKEDIPYQSLIKILLAQGIHALRK
jgi:predicted DNA binding CopG/RHH family protein